MAKCKIPNLDSIKTKLKFSIMKTMTSTEVNVIESVYSNALDIILEATATEEISTMLAELAKPVAERNSDLLLAFQSIETYIKVMMDSTTNMLGTSGKYSNIIESVSTEKLDIMRNNIDIMSIVAQKLLTQPLDTFNTKGTTQVLDREEIQDEKSSFSGESDDTSSSMGEQNEFEELSDRARILRPLKTRSIRKVIKSYLVDELVDKHDDLINLFYDKVGDSWLSTKKSAVYNEDVLFDSTEVKNKIIADLKSHISDYYKRSAVFSTAYKTDNGAVTEILAYNSITNMPSYRVQKSVAVQKHRMSEFKLYEGTDNEKTINMFSSKHVVDSSNKKVLLIQGDSLTKEDITEVLFMLTNGNASNQYNIFEEENANLPRIDRSTALENIESETVLSTYFAHVIVNEFDTFVTNYAEMLDSTYKELVRIGPIRTDKIGSRMANKMVRLGIISTPMLYEDGNISKELTALTSELTNRTDTIHVLNKLGNIKTIDSNLNKVFTFSSLDTNRAEINSIGMVVGFGSARSVIVNNEYADGTNEWVFPKIVGNKVTFVTDASEVTSNIDISAKLESLALSLTNTDLNALKTLGNIVELRNNAMLTVLGVNNTYSDSAEDTITMNTVPGIDKYLTEPMLEVASELLYLIPRSPKEAGKFLKEIFTNSKSPLNKKYASIARSIYYKYFHIGEYKITSLNSITGLIETTTNQSLYHKALKTGNKVLMDSVYAMLSNMASVVLDNKIYSDNGFLVKTEMQNARDITSFMYKVDNTGMEYTNAGDKMLNSKTKNYFKVNKIEDGVLIKFYGSTFTDSNKNPDLQFTIIKVGGKYNIVGNSSEKGTKFTTTLINNMLQRVKSPTILKDEKFQDTLFNEFKATENPEKAFNAFYGAVIALKLANAYDNVADMTYSDIDLFAPNSDSSVKYTFDDNMFGYKDVLTSVLEKTIGRSVRSKVRTPDGAEYHSTIVGNRDKRRQLVAKDIAQSNESSKPIEERTHLFKYNKIANGRIKIIGNGMTKSGIGRDNEGKSNSGLTKKEQATFYLDVAQLQTAAAARIKFTESMVMGETASDRTKVSVFNLTSEEYSVLPIKEFEGKKILDEHMLSTAYKDTWANSFKGVKEHTLIKWKQVLHSIHKNTIPISKINTSSIEFSETAIDAISTLPELHSFLFELKLDYDELLHKTGLIENLTLSKDSNRNANINYAMASLSEIVLGEDEVLKDTYINLFKMKYKEFMIKEADVVLSPMVINIIANRFGFSEETDFNKKRNRALDLALDSQFYVDSIGEQELAQLGMGNVFGYKNAKTAGLFADLDMNIPNASPDMLIRAIGNTKLATNETIKEISYDDASRLGSYGNNAGFIKSILGTKEMPNNLTNEQKVTVLRFNDIFTQMSPMYIDRVKRNQALGTSGMSPTLAVGGEASMALDQETEVLLIADPVIDVHTLGSGFIPVEVYNGGQFAESSYLIKLNASLGDTFSNYRGTGIRKTMNASEDEDGVVLYEKHAAFPQFVPEVLMYSSPRHTNLSRVLMDTIKFESKDNEYDGIFLDENVYTPSKDYKNPLVQMEGQTAISQLLKHGEYLETVSIGEDGEIINVYNLLFDIDQGTISDAMIQVINEKGLYTTKKFYSKEQINSKYDLYNHYGGVEGDHIMKSFLNTNNERANHNEVFPYGWVAHSVTKIMTHYRGVGKNYPIRNAEIGKVEVVTSTKNGIAYVNSPEVLTNPQYDLKKIKTKAISNKYLVEVLKATHEHDTTAEYNMTEHDRNNQVAIVTQIFNAAEAQGNTHDIVVDLYGATGILSKLQLDNVKSEKTSLAKRSEQAGMSSNKLMLVESARGDLEERNSTTLTSELLGMTDEHAAKVALDMKMVLPFIRSSFNSKINKRVVKLRLPGGQFILAPIEDQIKTYSYNGAIGIYRNSLSSSSSINGIIKEAILNSNVTTGGIPSLDGNWKLQTVFSEAHFLKVHNPLDYVYIRQDDGTLVPVKVADLLVKDTQKYLAERSIDEQTVLEKNDLINKKREGLRNTVTSLKLTLSSLKALTKYGKTVGEIDAQNAHIDPKLLTPDVITILGGEESSTPLINIGKTLQEEILAVTASVVDSDYNVILTEEETNKLEFLSNARKSSIQTPLKSLIDEGKVFSVWVDNDGSNAKQIEGETLQWLNYFRNGKSLYESDEFMAYMAASTIADKTSKNGSLEDNLAAVAEIVGMPYNGESLIPKVLFARFMASRDSSLDLTPILGPKIIEQFNIHNVVSEPALLGEFFAWVSKYKGKEGAVQLVSEVKPQLTHLLEQPGWKVKEAEFYMPPMHQAAFLLREGDTMQMIKGMEQQPDLTVVSSIIITNPKTKEQRPLLSDEEVYLLETKYGDETNSAVAKIKKKLSDNAKGREYLMLRDKQQKNMIKFFSSRINEIESMVTKDLDVISNAERNGLVKRAPLLLLKATLESGSIAESLNIIELILKNKDTITNSELYVYLRTVKQALQTKKTVPKKILLEVTNKANLFKRMWATNLANNFDKTLTFITARIPAQGKQSAVVGKIKNFLFSSKNAIYSPLELFAINGGDYDIDKQNNITWDVDSTGTITSWDEYVDKSGKMSHEVITAIIVKRKAAFSRELTKAGVLKLNQNGTEESDKEHTNLLLDFEQAQYRIVSKATRNYVLNKLMEVYKHSENAIEAATVVAMNKVGYIADYLNSFKFSDLDITKYGLKKIKRQVGVEINEVGEEVPIIQELFEPSESLFEALQKRQHAIPYVPSTKLLFEKINMDGKSAVGFFASGLKSYLAAYFAYLNNDYTRKYKEEVNKLSYNTLKKDGINKNHGNIIKQLDKDPALVKEKEFTTLAMKSEDIIQIKNELPKIITDDSFYFVWRDESTGLFKINSNINSMANTRKHMPNANKVLGKLHDVRARQAYRKLIFATSIDEEKVILKKFARDFEMHKEMNGEAAAWADLSELLSAATDNAKEFILGRIGANNNTNSIIVAMIVMGIDLKAALTVINEPDIKEAIVEIDNEASLVGEKLEQADRLKTKLKTRLDTYNGKSVMSDEELKTKLTAEYIRSGKFIVDGNQTVTKSKTAIKEFNAELKTQKALRTHYNPAKQIELYLRVSEELSTLARILKINTDMANLEIDVLNYLIKIEKALPRKEDGSRMTLEEFIKATPSEMKSIIALAHDQKTAINIPYVLYKNKHYFTHLEGLAEANETILSESHTIRVLHNKIKPKLWKNVTTHEYSSFVNVIADASISKFYDERNSIISFDKHGTFDLSLTRSTVRNGRRIKGRLEFIQTLPDIVEESMDSNEKLRNNKLLVQIGRANELYDKMTGTSISLLSGVHLQGKSDGVISSYQLALSRIKDIDINLYNALFNYSLIVDKSGVNNTSISQLFEPEEYAEYNNFVHNMERNKVIDELFGSMDDAILSLLTPMIKKKLSTKKSVSNAETLRISVGSEMSEEDMMMLQEIYEEEMRNQEELYNMQQDEYANTSGEYINKMSNMYDVSDMDLLYTNNLKNEYNKKKIPKVFESLTNGLTYALHPLYKYVPITKSVPGAVIDLNLKPSMTIDKNLKDLGYDWGWEIVLEDGTLARLLKYNEEKGAYLTIDGEGKENYLLKEEIEALNPKFRLHRNAIILKRGVFTKTGNITLLVNQETNEIVIDKETQKKSGTAVDTVEFDINELDKSKRDDNTAVVSDILLKTIKLKSETATSRLNSNKIANIVKEDISQVESVYVNELELALKSILLEATSDKSIDVTQEQIYKRLVSGSTAYDQNVIFKKLTDMFEEIKDTSTDYIITKRYMMLRKPLVDTLKDIVIEMDLDVDIDTLGLDENMFSTFSNLRKLTNTSQAYTLDAEMLGTESIATSFTLGTYVGLLNDIFNISPNQYRAAVDLDSIRIGNKLYYKDSLVKVIHKEDIKTTFKVPNSLRKKKLKSLSPKAMSKLSLFLNKRFKNTNVLLLSLEDIETLYPEINISDTTESFVRTGSGLLVLIKERATLDSLLHEMGHLYLAELKNTDHKFYETLMRKMEGDIDFDVIAEKYKDKPGYTELNILEEVFVYKFEALNSDAFSSNLAMELDDNEIYEMLTDTEFNNSTAILSTFKNIFEDFFGAKLKKNSTLSLDDSILDIMYKIGSDIVFNKKSYLHTMTKVDKLGIKKLMYQNSTLTRKQALDLLKQKNYIVKVC